MSRTLADMTPDERHQMVGRWAEVEGHRHLGVINSAPDEDEDQYPHPPYDVQIIFPLHAWASAENTTNDQVTPRLDLPPAWTPEGQPVPMREEWSAPLESGGASITRSREEAERIHAEDWKRYTTHGTTPYDALEPPPPRPAPIRRRHVTEWEEA